MIVGIWDSIHSIQVEYDLRKGKAVIECLLEEIKKYS